MTDTAIEVDVKGLENLFEELAPKQLRSASRSAFNKAGRIILNAAKEEYRSMFPGSVLEKDMHMKAYRSGKGVMVDLLYTKRHDKGDPLYKSYVMKILEVGNYKTARVSTGNYKGRSTTSASAWVAGRAQARANRGTLRAYHFFQNGTSSAKLQAQHEFNGLLEAAIQKQIQKAG